MKKPMAQKTRRLHKVCKYYKEWRIKINNDWVPEHRYMLEKLLHRKLTPKETIHHKDGNHLNNKLSNLIILSRKEHSIMHKRSALYNKILTASYNDTVCAWITFSEIDSTLKKTDADCFINFIEFISKK